MNIEIVRDFLLWCFVINFGLLLWWFLFLAFAHDFVYRMHTKWFKLSVEEFDAIHYKTMALFKLFVFTCNLVPYLAILIVT